MILVVVIYLSIDIFGRMDNLMSAGLTPFEMAVFFACKVPLIISQITPVAVLLGVLVVFGMMSRNNEIIALKSSGVSLLYLLAPVFGIGVILSGALFLFSEVVVPLATIQAHELAEKPSADARAAGSRQENIWLKQPRSILHVQYFHPSEDTVHGISALFFDEAFNLERRLDARKGRYEDGWWHLSSAMVQSAAKERADARPAGMDIDYYENRRVKLPIVPADLKKVARTAEEMGFATLRRYIEKVEREGYDATRYKVDLYAKTAFPAICLIMSLLGSAIALRGRTREGMAVSFAYGIVTAFIYWSLYSLCLSLGYGGVLPPFLAAWIVNLVFFCASGLMVLNLE